MSDNYLSNKAGERINPASDDKLRDVEDVLDLINLDSNDLVLALAAEPIKDSGQKLTDATGDADTLAEVEPGLYAFNCMVTGAFYMGLADVTVAKNVRWCCGINQSILIKIPAGEYTLHYACSTANGIGYLRKLS